MRSPFAIWKDAKDREAKQEPEVKEDYREQTDEASTYDTDHQPVIMTASKANLDKKSLDLLFAVDQMIQAKAHAEMSIYEYQDRLTHASGNVDRLTRDLKNMGRVVEEREKSILELEQKLIEKNLKLDQMMDDCRDIQNGLSEEIEELKNVIDLEQQKYSSLLQKHNEAQLEKSRKINELEEKIGKLAVEHAHLTQKFEEQREEKAYLLSMIQDFTTRMSSPLEAIRAKHEDGNGSG
ncbi:hypothetical protein [Paenibacillus puerhi]|uniref:hypothetical protein n=1 Tax=Paenibacillus puerhi TaxID=2692622 RepID=UPI0013592E77|nr:hypothetical protein [Paenibacillus puerhi]